MLVMYQILLKYPISDGCEIVFHFLYLIPFLISVYSAGAQDTTEELSIVNL